MAHKRTPVDFVKMAEEAVLSKLALTDKDREEINQEIEKLGYGNPDKQAISLSPPKPAESPVPISTYEVIKDEPLDLDDDTDSIGGLSDDIEVIEEDEELPQEEPSKITGDVTKMAESSHEDLKKKKSHKKVKGVRAPEKPDDHVPASVPVNAMVMKIEQNVKDLSKDGLRGDNRMGWVGSEQYTISDFWQAKDRVLTECSPDVVSQIREYWYEDRWNGLVNPPSWVSLELFRECIPSTATNQAAGSALLLASVNLELAKARSEGNSRRMLELVKKNDYHLLAPLDTFGTAVKKSERAIIEAMKVTQAANKGAIDTLMVAETFTERLRTQVKAVTEDATCSSEHKTDQLLEAVKTLAKKEDVTSGSLKAGAPGHVLAGSGSNNKKSKDVRDMLRSTDPPKSSNQNQAIKKEESESSKPKNWFPPVAR